MPKDLAPGKRKTRATDEPTPLYDNATRGFLSVRTSAPAVTASNITTHRLSARSKFIPGLPAPLLGAFNEAIYARPTGYDDDDMGHVMDPNSDPSTPTVIQSELPGVTIKQVRCKRYLNSVSFYFTTWRPFINCVSLYRTYLLLPGRPTVTSTWMR